MRLKPFGHPVTYVVLAALFLAFAFGGSGRKQEATQETATSEVASITPDALGNDNPSSDATDDAASLAGSTSVAEPDVGGPTQEEAETVGQGKPEVYLHEVQPGETLTDIAQAYEIDVDTILAANQITDPNRIRPGDHLSILSVKGVLHTVERGESLWDISRMYRVTMDDIMEANTIDDPARLKVRQELVIPGAQAIAVQRNWIADRSGRLLKNFSWPVRGRISSRFGVRWGRMHDGIDIAVNTGTPVRATADGRVSYAGWSSGYGNLVIVKHSHGIETRYAHNSKLLVRVGQQISRGQTLARSGNTGRSTGPHVHFEIRQYGKSVNPLTYLR